MKVNTKALRTDNQINVSLPCSVYISYRYLFFISSISLLSQICVTIREKGIKKINNGIAFQSLVGFFNLVAT